MRLGRDAIDAGACRIINIKPGRVGGHAESVRLHDLCAARGVPVWHGGMLESGIGRAHNLHLSTLPNFSLPGDVAASKRYYQPDLIEPGIEVGPDGMIPVPTGPGIGVHVVDGPRRARHAAARGVHGVTRRRTAAPGAWLVPWRLRRRRRPRSRRRRPAARVLRAEDGVGAAPRGPARAARPGACRQPPPPAAGDRKKARARRCAGGAGPAAAARGPRGPHAAARRAGRRPRGPGRGRGAARRSCWRRMPTPRCARWPPSRWGSSAITRPPRPLRTALDRRVAARAGPRGRSARPAGRCRVGDSHRHDGARRPTSGATPSPSTRTT